MIIFNNNPLPQSIHETDSLDTELFRFPYFFFQVKGRFLDDYLADYFEKSLGGHRVFDGVKGQKDFLHDPEKISTSLLKYLIGKHFWEGSEHT
jgi:hypothetical protein